MRSVPVVLGRHRRRCRRLPRWWVRGGPRRRAQAPEYRAPVPGPIVSAFSLPAERWMPGNRGVDYDPPSGTAVTAAADGEVVFAGSVGGTLHVTLRHADGLRTSYSFLAEVSVTTGGRVRQGDVVGVAGGPIHFGVRDRRVGTSTPPGSCREP